MNSRKLYSIIVVLLIASFLITSCGTKAQTGAGPLQEIGEGEGAVSIIAWAGYIERGETDPAYDWGTQFEKDTGFVGSAKGAATST